MQSDTVKSNFTPMEARPSPTTRSPETLEERALEQGFVAHEAWAFEAVYKSYKRLLYGAAYGVLQDSSDAEDCVHDVLTRLWQRGHAYSTARGRLQAFLAVCVRNEALGRVRSSVNRARIQRSVRGDLVEPAADEHVVERLRISNVLDSLSAPQRESIQLAYYDGLTHEQIALRLGQPVGTVKSRLSNALRELRALLQRSDAL